MPSPENKTMKLPAPLSSIPFYPLNYPHPSPIHLLPNLTARLSESKLSATNTATGAISTAPTSIYVKREDQSGPFANHGNKFRKFEYLVPHIQSLSPTVLVTEGAVQSNHTAQVVSLAAHLGLRCRILLHKNVGGGYSTSTNKERFLNTGNAQVCKLLGADIVFTEEKGTGDQTGPEAPCTKYITELVDQGEKPYWISSGASLHPLGGLGYARCAFEILEQEKQLDLIFDTIYVACGSGSTLAGLIAGFVLAYKHFPTIPRKNIVGVLTSRTKSLESQQSRILALSRKTGLLIGLDEQDICERDVILDDRFVGERYGVLDPETTSVLQEIARGDGVLLDPVYTGKVMRGLVHAAETGEIHGNVLFMHTGGQGVLSAYNAE